MTERRNFMRLASAVALPAAVAVAGAGAVRAQDGDAKEFLGAWTTIHTLPFPPNWFREFLTFTSGGGLLETNTFLNLAAPQDFSMYGLPKAMKASDGMGNWESIGKGRVKVAFRKLLFDGDGGYFGDLKVSGIAETEGTKIYFASEVSVEDVAGKLLVPFGSATSDGFRIR